MAASCPPLTSPRLRRHVLAIGWAMLAVGAAAGCDADDAGGEPNAPQSGSSGPGPSSEADTLYTTGISASASEGESDSPDSDSPDSDDTDPGPDPNPPRDTDPGADCDDQTPCPQDDGNLCNVSRCDDGVCIQEPVDCERDSNACADASCEPSSGACIYAPADDACGSADTCSTPRCTVTLEADGALLEAVCDIENHDGRVCDDADPCTQADACESGSCEGTALSCDSPPAPTCAGATLQTSIGGSCNAGDCDYATTSFSCPDGCDAGACAGPTHPLISEVLYDDEGTDDNVWIELWAPPGSSLNGVVIEFVNGSSGAVGDTYPLSGTVPADGIILIVSDAANSPSLLAAADFVDGIADLQNGPDNVRLRSGETILDALGYGSFDADETFAGEGSSTPDASPDRSLARLMSLVDTDDNSADFTVETAPTPGAINP